MDIQPQLLKFHELTHGRIFRIPGYQRAYSWGSKQREDLFEDIKRAKRLDEEHFMATVVGLRRRGDVVNIRATRYEIVEIVDGQQRLTTLVILLNAIRYALTPANADERAIADELRQMLVKGDGHTLLLLNHDINGVFKDYIRHGRIADAGQLRTSADQNITDAVEQCISFVQEWRSLNWNLNDLVQFIRYQLLVVFHMVEDEGLVYRVFEVLNSRGLEVAAIDKLKSQLMGLVFEADADRNREGAITELHEIWQSIYQAIGRRKIATESLRFAATLKAPGSMSHRRPLSSEVSLKVLVESAGTTPDTIIACGDWLKRVVEAENDLMGNHRWRAVTAILQARLVAIAVLLRRFPLETKDRILELWERITFRIYGLACEDARCKVGEYTELAWTIINMDMPANAIMARLHDLGRSHPIETVIREFDAENAYEGWTEELRYFLYRYEEHLAREAGQQLNAAEWNRIWSVEPARSVEHIRPQSSHVRYVHHLGNLIMLPPGVNQRLQDLPPARKVEAYRDGLLSSRRVADRIERDGWNERLVKRRADELLEWARDEWADR